jgi:hypothetical protein
MRQVTWRRNSGRALTADWISADQNRRNCEIDWKLTTYETSRGDLRRKSAQDVLQLDEKEDIQDERNCEQHEPHDGEDADAIADGAQIFD